MNFAFNISKYPLEPAQLCKSEQRPSSLPVGPVVASLGNQTPTPNSTGTVLCNSLIELQETKPDCIQSETEGNELLRQCLTGLPLAFIQHVFQWCVKIS